MVSSFLYSSLSKQRPDVTVWALFLFLENSADAVVTPFLLYFHYDLSACVLVASSSHLINVRAFLGVGAIVPAPFIDLVG